MEENRKKEKRDSFFNKIDHWIGAITAIPVFGVIIKMVFDKITEKGAAKLHERVEKILGFNVEDAKRDVSDEIIYSVVVNALSEDEAKEIDAFEESLRAKDCCKAEAFVLFIAKIVKTFEREIKETTSPKKGETGPRVEQVYKKLEEGIGHAKNFLKALLRSKGAGPDATFNARVAFLQGKNVFSLIRKKKEPPLKGFTDFVKKEGAEGLNKVKQSAVAETQSYKDRANARLAAAKERANTRRI